MKIFKKYYELSRLEESYSAMLPSELNEGVWRTAVDIGKKVWNGVVAVVKAFWKCLTGIWKAYQFMMVHVLGISITIKLVTGWMWGDYVVKGGEKLTGINMWSDNGERIRINYKGGISSQLVHSVDYWDRKNWNLENPTRTVTFTHAMDVGELGPMLRELTDGRLSMDCLHAGKVPPGVEKILRVETGVKSESVTSATVKVAENLDKIYGDIENKDERTEAILSEMELVDDRASKNEVRGFVLKNKNATIKEATLFATLLQSGMEPRNAETIALSMAKA